MKVDMHKREEAWQQVARQVRQLFDGRQSKIDKLWTIVIEASAWWCVLCRIFCISVFSSSPRSVFQPKSSACLSRSLLERASYQSPLGEGFLQKGRGNPNAPTISAAALISGEVRYPRFVGLENSQSISVQISAKAGGLNW